MTFSEFSPSGRSSLKRKLADSFDQVAGDAPPSPLTDIITVLRDFNLGRPYGSPDKSLVRRAAHQLAELCKQDEYVDDVVSSGAIEQVTPLLFISQKDSDCDPSTSQLQEELEKEACFILGLLAVKPDYQSRIANAGALPGLVQLLRTRKPGSASRLPPGSGGVARRAADAITNLAHENMDIKNQVREQGGIPPLVELLESLDMKVQRAAAGALRTLAFKNEENKNMIVAQKALSVLIQLLMSEDTGVHYEAVGVIGNLVHSSNHIKKQVLDEGALQPVINLLSSACPDSQRESALLLGQFATADADTKARIVQRGAVPPLVKMLQAEDISLKEMAAFALGRLAQNMDNQAGVVQCGGLPPLLDLLDSKHYNLQHNAAFALYGLADNEDNIAEMIRTGTLQRLEDCMEKLQVQASRDCVQKTIGRMEAKLNGASSPVSERALNHVTFLLRSSDKVVQQRAALALSKLAPDSALHNIFITKRGMDVLLDMLVDEHVPPRLQQQAAEQLLTLAEKLDQSLPVELEGQPAQPSVYLGSQYVNNPAVADVVFLVEGRKFHAHRIALLASSEAFRAMFSGGYKEKEANLIDIPNIPWDVFHAMMTFIYTGQVEVTPDVAVSLLQASDQYLLEGLKRLCETAIATSLTCENVIETFELSEAFCAPQLGKQCMLFMLRHWDSIIANMDPSAYFDTMERMIPCLRASFFDANPKS